MSGARIALVTGGAKRMGAAIARRLARAGWDVCIHYNTSRREAAELRDSLHAEGRRCALVQADLRIAEDLPELVQQCERQLGAPPTALVNNAAVFEYDTAQTVTAEHLQRTLSLNFVAPVLLAKAFAAATATGCIVNLLDQKIRNLNPDFFSYTLSKLALGNATELLARSLAPIRVCGIAPGISLPSGDQNTAEFERARRATPLGGSSTPEDIADAVLFLLEAKSITGEVLTVDGGQHMLPLERDIMFLQRSLSDVKA